MSNGEEAKILIKKWYVIRSLMDTLMRLGVIKEADISIMYRLFCDDLLPYFEEEKIASMCLQMIYQTEQKYGRDK